MVAEIKTCSQCKKAKPLSGFYPNRSAVDGHYDDCKACMKRNIKDQNDKDRQENLFNIYKTCTICNRPRPYSDFWKSKKHNDGHDNRCIVCIKERKEKKSLKYKQDNPYKNSKTCPVCDEQKMLSEFYKNKNEEDGHRRECKVCTTVASKKRHHIYKKNRSEIKSKTCRLCKKEKEIKDFVKDSREKDGYKTECKKCFNKMMREWHKENPGKARQAEARWRKNNRERHNKNNTLWAKKNPDKANANTLRAIKRKAVYKTHASKLTADEAPMMDTKGYLLAKCTYCGQYFNPTVSEVNRRLFALTHVAQGENRLPFPIRQCISRMSLNQSQFFY